MTSSGLTTAPSWRAPWLDNWIASTPAARKAGAMSGSSTPLTTSRCGQASRTFCSVVQDSSARVIDAIKDWGEDQAAASPGGGSRLTMRGSPARHMRQHHEGRVT